MVRKDPLVAGEIYHVMSKSIAGYQIFNTSSEYAYMLDALRYFTLQAPPVKLSFFLHRDPLVKARGLATAVAELGQRSGHCVQIIVYCLMPTHFHVLARQLSDHGISDALRRTLNAYTRYFNVRHGRRGPLWMGRFKSVRVATDEQFLHVTRYIHLNPVTAGLVSTPEEWLYSSYREYVEPDAVALPLVNYAGLVDVSPGDYRRFCEDHADYQKELGIIKHLSLD